jgi:hypothetical protein
MAIVFCTGMYGSGSTWLFNVTSAILRLSERHRQVVQMYEEADKNRLKIYLKNQNVVFVVKAHRTNIGVETTVRKSSARILISIRHPCDSAVSLMERFGFDFHKSLALVKESASSVIRIMDTVEPYRWTIIRYESPTAFLSDQIRYISRFLDCEIDEEHSMSLESSFSKENLSEEIAQMFDSGTMTAASLDYEPTSHWHRNHIGTGIVGKYKSLLNDEQIDAVYLATESIFKRFGYLI